MKGNVCMNERREDRYVNAWLMTHLYMYVEQTIYFIGNKKMMIKTFRRNKKKARKSRAVNKVENEFQFLGVHKILN